jgi:hypothetical protein
MQQWQESAVKPQPALPGGQQSVAVRRPAHTRLAENSITQTKSDT